MKINKEHSSETRVSNTYTERLESIPTDDLASDIDIIKDYIFNYSRFDEAFQAIQKIDFSMIGHKERIELCEAFENVIFKPKQTRQLYNFFSQYLSKSDIYSVFISAKFFSDILIPKFSVSSEDFKYIIPVFEQFLDPSISSRSLRQAVFRFASIRGECENCFSIIKTLHPAKSEDDYLEFTSYSTTMIPLLVQNDSISTEFFNFMMNMCPIFSGTQRMWIIDFVASFASLLRGKTIHQSVLDFVNFQGKPLSKIKHFENSTSSLYNPEFSYQKSPSLLLPYHFYKKCNIDITKLVQLQSEIDVYNALLNLCETNSPIINDILSQLPVKTSLPFYFILARNGSEEGFHKAIETGLKEGHHQVAIPILERAAKVTPTLVEQHFKSISKLGFEKCANLISYLIKSDIIDFYKLWKHVKNSKFNIVKPIIREGIVQMQRKSRSLENTRFIISIIANYFSDVHGEINWATVAIEFSEDFEMSSTILLNITKEDKEKNDNTKPLLKWRDQFMNFVKHAPGIYHQVLIVPFLLLVTGENQIPVEQIKWATSHLPASKTQSELIVEGFALLELCKHILSEKNNLLEATQLFTDLFGFDSNSISSYTSIFCHASLVLKHGLEKSYNLILDSLNNKQTFMTQAAKLAVNLLEIHGHKVEDNLHQSIMSPLTYKIVGLLSTLNLKSPEIDFNSADKEIVDMLITTHSLVTQSLSIALTNNQFASYKEMKLHFLRLSVACFLLLPSRMIPKSSVEKCIELIDSPSSSVHQKNFALRALSQVPSVPERNWLDLLQPETEEALCSFAVKHNNIEMIQVILEKSSNYSLIVILKPIIEFLDPYLLMNFLNKTAPLTSTEEIFNSIDLFVNPNHLQCVFSIIRQRSLIDIFHHNKYQKLNTALTKYAPQYLEQYVFTPFDDFALMASLESWSSTGNICWSIVSNQDKISLPCLFVFAYRSFKKLPVYISSLFALIQRATNDMHDFIYLVLAMFILVSSNKEPFLSIRLHYQANPLDINEEILCLLAPSLLSSSPKVHQPQFLAFEELVVTKYSESYKLSHAALSLKPL